MRNKRILSKYDGKKLGWFRWWKQLLIFVIVAIVLVNFVFGVTMISGNSMNPTLKNGQMVGIMKVGKGHLEVGDVVAVHMTSGERYVKRIVAVAGDTVEVKEGKLFVNGEQMEESYAVGNTEPEEGNVTYPYVVEEGRYFIMGDNRENSVDSRSFGSIFGEQIMGKVIFMK